MTSTATTALAASMRDGYKDYGTGDTAVRALDGISVDIARSEFTAIMGPSGSGKSTLLHTLAGLDRLTAGQSTIADLVITGMSEAQITEVRRDNIGFVFQSFNLIPSLNARENITLPLDIAGRDLDPAWFDEIITILALGDRLTHLPAELSGGQQQRVAVARALVASPKLILADEPTGNLDTHHGEEVMRMLQTLNGEGSTIVMVTHSPAHADYAGRIVSMLDGRILQERRRAA